MRQNPFQEHETKQLSPRRRSRRTASFLNASAICCALALLPIPARSEPSSPVAALQDSTESVSKSVVKIFTTVRYPDFFKPWTKQSPVSLVGSGVVIEGKRILSNAHVIQYASQVQIQANEAGDKISGTVVGVSPEMDLAVIKLDDESFFDSHPPLRRGAELPEIQDTVKVYGFPTGGSSMSITKGIVSRIEFASYTGAGTGLRIQVDAAINSGNSGGPAMVGDNMIGLAYSVATQAQNIGYIIPCEEIELFLTKMVDGQYHGRPLLREKHQPLQNSALRAYLHVDKSVHGVVVQQISPIPKNNPLQKWDIITEIGDIPIDDEGMVILRSKLRVSFTYLINKMAREDRVPLTVIRDGKTLPLEVPVMSNPPYVMAGLNGSYPSYFVYGPLAFSQAAEDLIPVITSGRTASIFTKLLIAQGSPLFRRWGDSPAFDGEQLVFVTTLFPHKISRGYSDPITEVVKSVNGTTIKNLAHLVEVLRDAKDPFVTIEFCGKLSDTLVFKRDEILANTDEILSDNNVRSQGSPDMMAVWNEKKN